jgi:hypothetical protein
MDYKYKRIVVGKNPEGKSAVLTKTGTNVQASPNQFYRATLWRTSEIPVDNSIEGDRANGSIDREPPPGGCLVRVLEFYPDNPDRSQKKFFLPLEIVSSSAEQIMPTVCVEQSPA